MKMFNKAFVLIIILLVIPSLFFAEEVKLQRAVPYGILSRVFPIKYGKEGGTCFVIDLDGKQYILTAKHILPNAKDGDSIEVYISGQWHPLIIKPIFPKNVKTDIAALAANRLIAIKMPISIGSKGIFVGQDIYFLGFPFGLASQTDDPSGMLVPFIKKGILSAIDFRASSGHVFYLDGHNNSGFSGGPVIFANYNEKEKLYIAGVISGYRNQKTKVIEEIEQSQNLSSNDNNNVIRYVLENTGIVVAYSIDEIIKEISENPIGFPLPAEIKTGEK